MKGTELQKGTPKGHTKRASPKLDFFYAMKHDLAKQNIELPKVAVRPGASVREAAEASCLSFKHRGTRKICLKSFRRFLYMQKVHWLLTEPEHQVDRVFRRLTEADVQYAGGIDAVVQGLFGPCPVNTANVAASQLDLDKYDPMAPVYGEGQSSKNPLVAYDRFVVNRLAGFCHDVYISANKESAEESVEESARASRIGAHGRLMNDQESEESELSSLEDGDPASDSASSSATTSPLSSPFSSPNSSPMNKGTTLLLRQMHPSSSGFSSPISSVTGNGRSPPNSPLKRSPSPISSVTGNRRSPSNSPPKNNQSPRQRHPLSPMESVIQQTITIGGTRSPSGGSPNKGKERQSPKGTIPSSPRLNYLRGLQQQQQVRPIVSLDDSDEEDFEEDQPTRETSTSSGVMGAKIVLDSATVELESLTVKFDASSRPSSPTFNASRRAGTPRVLDQFSNPVALYTPPRISGWRPLAARKLIPDFNEPAGEMDSAEGSKYLRDKLNSISRGDKVKVAPSSRPKIYPKPKLEARNRPSGVHKDSTLLTGRVPPLINGERLRHRLEEQEEDEADADDVVILSDQKKPSTPKGIEIKSPQMEKVKLQSTISAELFWDVHKKVAFILGRMHESAQEWVGMAMEKARLRSGQVRPKVNDDDNPLKLEFWKVEISALKEVLRACASVASVPGLHQWLQSHPMGLYDPAISLGGSLKEAIDENTNTSEGLAHFVYGVIGSKFQELFANSDAAVLDILWETPLWTVLQSVPLVWAIILYQVAIEGELATEIKQSLLAYQGAVARKNDKALEEANDRIEACIDLLFSSI